MDEFLVRLRQPILKQIIDLLPGNEPYYLVGGAVRDALLNRPNYDLDFLTPGDASVIARRIADQLGAAYFPLDIDRNVARFIIKSDRTPDDGGRKNIRVDFSTYQGPDLISDLQRRDFTMNAIAVDVRNMHALIDPLGGAKDLLSKQLRTCSQTSLSDDPVRVLRAVRFAVNLDLSIPSELLQLIRQATGRIPEVSAERLRDELFRILLQLNPGVSMRILDKVGALEYVLPELTALKGVRQSPPHVMDVWNHTLDILARLESLLDLLLEDFNPEMSGSFLLGLVALRLGRYRQQFKEHFNHGLNPERPHRGLLFLAGLYHDVGKRHTQSVDETGRIRFLEHEQISSDLVVKRGQALKLSNLEIDRLQKIARHHMRPSLLSHENEKEIPTRRAIYRFFRETGTAGVDICLLSLADVLATYGPTLPQERWIRHLDVVRALLSAWWESPSESVLPPAIINGDELMAEFSLPSGPLIGYLIESIREGQAAGEIKDREGAVRKAKIFIKEYKQKTGGE